ncbi:PIG-L deacetylase family protein [Pseudonocardia sp. KRD291]|uniref:PIG-L deacetylase family protein n=1 Tax=Pseudonocardia sp. KRD291 TaxID=2792007 RepID=UPI001C49E57D|nr:PIG-L deacetylase family protein [Pseudonocardia sp. KRD291]
MTILVIAPHTDDGELGAGGSIARWVEEGHEVHYVALSACESSVPDHLPSDVLRTEVALATKELGIQPGRVRVLDFEVRRFPRDRQEVLQVMVDLNRDLRPGLVLLPGADDLHQDHQVVGAEGLRAFKHTSVLGYEIAWNNTAFRTASFVALEERHVEAKIAALGCYGSQAHRPYASADFLRSQVRFHGVRAGTTFAETFEVHRWIL